MATPEKGYLPGEYKYAFTITASGFDMDEDDFEVVLNCGKKKKTIPKSECFTDRDGQWYFAFDSQELGTGMVTATFMAAVPDDDFPDRYRTEVARVDLIYLAL